MKGIYTPKFTVSDICCQNGHSLGESQGIEDMWRTGMKNYEQSQWQVTVDMVEEALRLFHRYENESYLCLKKCKEEGELAQ